MNLTSKGMLIASLAFFALTGKEAGATLVTFGFQGTVDTISAPLAGTFDSTQTIAGSFTFESSTTDSNPDSSIGWYLDALTAVTFTIDGYTGSSTGGNITILDNNQTLPDSFILEVFPVSAPSVDVWYPISLRISLADPTNTAFTTDALPTALTLSDFPLFPSWTLRFADNPPPPQAPDISNRVGGTLTYLVAPVPEPGTLALLSLGLAGMGLARRRKEI